MPTIRVERARVAGLVILSPNPQGRDELLEIDRCRTAEATARCGHALVTEFGDQIVIRLQVAELVDEDGRLGERRYASGRFNSAVFPAPRKAVRLVTGIGVRPARIMWYSIVYYSNNWGDERAGRRPNTSKLDGLDVSWLGSPRQNWHAYPSGQPQTRRCGGGHRAMCRAAIAAHRRAPCRGGGGTNTTGCPNVRADGTEGCLLVAVSPRTAATGCRSGSARSKRRCCRARHWAAPETVARGATEPRPPHPARPSRSCEPPGWRATAPPDRS